MRVIVASLSVEARKSAHAILSRGARHPERVFSGCEEVEAEATGYLASRWVAGMNEGTQSKGRGEVKKTQGKSQSRGSWKR